MPQIAPVSFGLVIAYFLPGVIAVYALRYSSPKLDALLLTIERGDNVVGPAVIVVIAALTAGLLLSCVRGLTLERLFRRLGVAGPRVDYKRLDSAQRMKTFQEIIDNVYRYYQFYANGGIALTVFLVLRHSVGGVSINAGWRSTSLSAIILVGVVVLMLAAKRQYGDLADALKQLEKKNGTEGGHGSEEAQGQRSP